MDRHGAGEKEVFRTQIEPIDHVCLGGVVLITRRDGMTIDAKIGKIIEHPFDLLHIGFLVDRCIGRDLITEHLRHFDGQNAFLEHALALHDQVVRSLKTVDVHVPIHPLAWRDRRLRRILRTFANFRRVFFRNQTLRLQEPDFLFQFSPLPGVRFSVFRGQRLAHFLAHEHGIGADVNDPLLREQAVHQRLDVRIDERFATAN